MNEERLVWACGRAGVQSLLRERKKEMGVHATLSLPLSHSVSLSFSLTGPREREKEIKVERKREGER
jgi:hypothetical protein